MKHAQAELSSLSATMGGDHEDSPGRTSGTEREEREAGGGEGDVEREGGLENVEKKRSETRQHREREKAARIIQASWRQHRRRVCNSPRLRKKELLMCERNII